MAKLFGILFVSTGVFAILGGLYTWGDGSIFQQRELIKVLIPLADVILTGPLSLACGYGILKHYKWGGVLGLATSGIYVFGSTLVFISIFWNNDYSIFLIVPALSGAAIGVGYISFVLSGSTTGVEK